MRCIHQAWKACVLIVLLPLAACQSPSREVSNRPTAGAANSQPAPAEPAAGAELDRDRVKPGIYKFTAKVKSVRVMVLDPRDKVIHGVATIDGERCVFTGVDVNWAILLDVQEVAKPLWFLKAGKPVTVVLHSPTHVFRKPGEEACGEVFDFSLKITRANDGELHFGPLTAVAG